MKLALALGLAVLATTARVVHAKGCHETSSIVGIEHCDHFGSWSADDDAPRLTVDIGYLDQHVRSDPFTLDSTPLPAHSAAIPTTTAGFLLRVLYGFANGLYTGGEGTIGDASAVPIGAMPTSSAAEAIRAVVGVHHTVLRFGVAAELAAGVRGEQFYYCGTAMCMERDVSQSRLELAARVRFDVFFNPAVSLGVGVGRSLVDSDDTQLLIYLGVHVRALDGL